MSGVRIPRHGRRLDDLLPGQTYEHPWEVTLDEGLLALFGATWLDATPVYASRPYARAVGFRDRPVHPLVLFNLALGIPTHDIFEQSVGHLAYLDVRFPEACYAGDTIAAKTKIVAVSPTADLQHGKVTTRTVLESDAGQIVAVIGRKALLRSGSVTNRAPGSPPRAGAEESTTKLPALPSELRKGIAPPRQRARFCGYFEDFDLGDILIHPVGKTLGDSEQMLLNRASRDTHPLHADEILCRQKAAAGTRAVAGGLVLAQTVALTSRDLAGNALWDLGYDHGEHPVDAVAGDTLYASTKVIAKEEVGPHAGLLTLRIVGTKNRTGEDFLLSGLFNPESAKIDGKIREKVVEVTRLLLVLKRPP